MIYVEAPEAIPIVAKPFVTKPPKLFVAGGITGTHDWQTNLVRSLEGLNIVVFNPRRKNFPMGDPDAGQIQIEWEYAALRLANAVSFWFPPETLCPITLYELGRATLNVPYKSLFVGCDPGYARKFDLEVQLRLCRPDVKLVYSLDDLSSQIHNWHKENK